MSELYLWFVQKAKSNGARPKPPYPLPSAIADVMRATNYKNDIIVSPGFLSKNQNTTNRFMNEFDKLLDQSPRNIRLGFFLGMGKQSMQLYLNYHEKELLMNQHVFTFGPEFQLDSRTSDHRKMIFLYTIPPESRRGATALSNCNAFLDLNAALEFTDLIKVNAVAIGSSNFSNRTYFDSSYFQAEADLMLLAHDENAQGSDFSSIIANFEGSRSALASNYPGSVFAHSTYIADTDDPHEFLNRIMRETIKGQLA